MKRIIIPLILFMSLISVVYGASPSGTGSIVLEKPIIVTNHLRAYEARTATGKRIVYVTNLREDGHRMGGDLPSKHVHFRETTITGVRRPLIIVSSKNVEKNTRPADVQNGIPVCYWRGQIVSPVLYGNRLVCPSESAAYSNGRQ